MIKDISGKKVTAKLLASEVLFFAVQQGVEYWEEQHFAEGLTEKEKQQVFNQLKKYERRLHKLLGYQVN